MSTRRILISNQAEFEELRLQRAKSLMWQQLDWILPNLGTMYSSIELELGPRRGVHEFLTHAEQCIVLHTDASCGSKGNRWMAIAFRRYAHRCEQEIFRKNENINDLNIEYATPAEAFAVCKGLELVKEETKNGSILWYEPIELYVDNSAIYWKLVKDLPFGRFSELYERMIGLSRPLKETGRLQIFRSTHFTNRADRV